MRRRESNPFTINWGDMVDKDIRRIQRFVNFNKVFQRLSLFIGKGELNSKAFLLNFLPGYAK